jgi:hypothetical protein
MATRKIYDLAVKTGSYTNQSGEQKNRYQNVGAVFEKDDGGRFISLAKWFNPAGVVDERGGESILLSMFEPRDKQQQSQIGQTKHQPQAQQPSAQQQAQLDDDDIPF